MLRPLTRPDLSSVTTGVLDGSTETKACLHLAYFPCSSIGDLDRFSSLLGETVRMDSKRRGGWRLQAKGFNAVVSAELCARLCDNATARERMRTMMEIAG